MLLNCPENHLIFLLSARAVTSFCNRNYLSCMSSAAHFDLGAGTTLSCLTGNLKILPGDEVENSAW